jgi:hypothetical protein
LATGEPSTRGIHNILPTRTPQRWTMDAWQNLFSKKGSGSVGAVAEVGLTGQGRVWWLRTNGVNNKSDSHQY